MAQVRLARVIPSMHVHLCVASWLFLFACLVLYFVPPFSFQPFPMFTSAFNERSRSNTLCDFRLGTVVASDHETPLTGYELKKDLNLVNTEELDLGTRVELYVCTKGCCCCNLPTFLVLFSLMGPYLVHLVGQWSSSLFRW